MSTRENMKWVLIFFYSIILFSCVKDKPSVDITLPTQTSNGVWLGNEGSFGNQNAEISFIDLQSDKIYNNLYAKQNNKPLGDILQHFLFINDEMYLSVNNSKKVVVLDRFTLQEKYQIDHLESPRYLCHSGAYIFFGSLYKPLLYKYNIFSKALETIPFNYMAIEHMVVKNNYLYVTCWDTSNTFLYKIQIDNNEIQAINLLEAASHSIVVDKNGMLWILCGNKYKQKKAYLIKFDPITETIEKKFIFNATDDPIRLVINTEKDNLYFINVDYNGGSNHNGLYKMAIYDTVLPTTPFIHAPANTYFYAVGINPITNEIFISNPMGFAQQSIVYKYNTSGQLLQTYKAGIGVNQFIFVPQ